MYVLNVKLWRARTIGSDRNQGTDLNNVSFLEAELPLEPSTLSAADRPTPFRRHSAHIAFLPSKNKHPPDNSMLRPVSSPRPPAPKPSSSMVESKNPVQPSFEALFSIFLSQLPPPPPDLRDTPETIVSLKNKSVELRDRLIALEPLKGTPAWDTVKIEYSFMHCQRQWIFCRVLRINQLVGAAHDCCLGHALMFITAHRDLSPNLPPHLGDVAFFASPTPSDVGLPEVEAHRHRRRHDVEPRLVHGQAPVRTIRHLC